MDSSGDAGYGASGAAITQTLVDSAWTGYFSAMAQIAFSEGIGAALGAIGDALGLGVAADAVGLETPKPVPAPKASPCPPKMVDPGQLRLPPNREGADPFKLSQQMQQYGTSTQGMPPILSVEDPNGEMMILDGVTRATRIDTFNQINSTVNNVPVVVIQQTTADLGTLPTVANPP
jgi:hypothetical protein